MCRQDGNFERVLQGEAAHFLFLQSSIFLTKTSVYLNNLIENGIVKREFSIDAKIKEKANASRGTYRLTDNFFRFWYAFVFTNFLQLEDGDVDGVYDYVISPALHESASFAFEDICKEFVKELQKQN